MNQLLALIAFFRVAARDRLIVARHCLPRPAGIGPLNLEVSFPAVGSTA